MDLFTGTTRVAQEFKRRGIEVTATDLASYSEVLSDCYIATDAGEVDRTRPARPSSPGSTALPGEPGYVTRTFCEEARFFQPHNGAASTRSAPRSSATTRRARCVRSC